MSGAEAAEEAREEAVEPDAKKEELNEADTLAAGGGITTANW